MKNADEGKGGLDRIIGRVAWSPPPWWVGAGAMLTQGCGWVRANPRALLAMLAGAAILTGSVALPWSWWLKHRPRELGHNVVRQVALNVSLPPAAVTPGFADEDFKPSPLRLTFSGAPVAPQERIGREALGAVTLSPALPGVWVWIDGSTLEFRPQNAWPPGTGLTVRVDPRALAKDVVLDATTRVLTTPPLVARISSFEFYNSPKDPAVHQLVGEIQLSHPVDAALLRQSLGMQVIGGSPLFAGGAAQLTLSADPKSARRFFVRSQPIGIPLKEDWVKLTLAKGLVAKQGGEPLRQPLEAKVRVPDKFSGLKITGASTRIIRTEEGEPEQVLFVQTDQAIDSAQIAGRIALWWHPQRWYSNHDKLDFAGRVGQASRIALTPVESEAPLSTSHVFRFTEPRTHGSTLLRIERGAKSPGGFEIKLDYERVIDIPAFPKETRILGKGNVLALHGERKLLVQSRGIDHLRITLGRVPIEQFQHLIATTGYSEFGSPEFEDGRFSENNLVQRWSKVVAVPRKNDWEATRSEVDLADAPPIAGDQPGGRGVFFVLVEPVKRKEVEAEGDDVQSRIEEPYLYNDAEDRSRTLWYGSRSFDPGDGWEPSGEETSERFLMVTDLGLLVKAGADDTRDVFVMSLAQGAPVAGVEIRAIARNGSTLHSAVTDAAGHANLPDFNGMVGERLPIAVLALKDGDVSFLPFNERQLPAMDYSRFNIDGVIASRIKALESFIFTERGVYRPGDTVHAGVITRRRDWQPVLEGLPLAITLSDPQGRSMGRQLVRLPYDGYFACDFQVPETANLGVYDIEVDVLDAQGHYRFRLGSGHVRVEEFQPDRMKVATHLDPAPPAGWIDSAQTTAEVSVRSLFDEPAPERRVSMKLELTPASFGFKEWPGYSFYDRAAASSISSAGRVVELGEQTTDEEGKASFELPLNTFDSASFHMAVLTEAFERDGGRSVRHATSVLVSSFDHVIGSKSDVDLDTLTKDADCALDLVAVGRDLKSVGLDGMRLRVIGIRQVSVLTQHDNGNYAYVSTTKESTLSEQPFVIAEGGVRWKPPTGVPGRYRMELVDAEGSLHCAVPFQVVGKGDPGIALDRATELGLQLSKSEALPGEEIEVFLTAPYIGAGLITIEREKVVASQWFQADAKSSSVKLRIPAGLEGTYYINAAYVRGTSQPEIFHSPLSYAAAPLRVLAPAKQLKLRLESPAEVRPGSDAIFKISSDRPAKVVVYAVDEGIHQITGYKLPQPLDHFLRKQALEVRTQQWLDLLLPEYRFLKSASAFGGDGDANLLSMHLNPFKRRQEPPVVYWSGLVETGPQVRELSWRVPDYFNGNLRVMAVAVQAGGIGVAEVDTLVKAPIILQPNAPLFVAPGDEFEASLTVFNHLPATGNVPIEIQASGSELLEVIGRDKAMLSLAPSTEGSVQFRYRAKAALGGTELKFVASGGGERIGRTTTLSVRPSSHYRTEVVTGWWRTGSKEQPVKRVLYPQFRNTEAIASVAPLGLALGLEAYVREYPYGCSEQITSRAMVKLIAAGEADFGISPKQASDALDAAIRQLEQRQRADGGFGYWYAAQEALFEFHSLYVLHFLTEAKLLGHAVPERMMQRALEYAAATAREPIDRLEQAELQAYAIYLLARNGTNPATQMLNLRDTLEARFKANWKTRPIAAWMAATYMLLKQDGEGEKLLDACLKARGTAAASQQVPWDYHATRQIGDLQVFYLQCRHFPARARDFGIEDLEPIMKPLRDQSFNTLSCSYTVLALKAYADLAKATGLKLSIAALMKDAREPARLLVGPATGIVRSSFAANVSALRFDRVQKGAGDIGAFYQVTEQGYDADGAGKVERSGLEVSREMTPLRKDRALRPGDPLDVVLRVRNVSGRDLSRLAVVDLMPAGFEVVAGDLRSGADTVAGAELTELREDRTLFFISLGANDEWSVKYRIKAVAAGSFVVPQALVEDMYDRGLHGSSAAGRIEVVREP